MDWSLSGTSNDILESLKSYHYAITTFKEDSCVPYLIRAKHELTKQILESPNGSGGFVPLNYMPSRCLHLQLQSSIVDVFKRVYGKEKLLFTFDSAQYVPSECQQKYRGISRRGRGIVALVVLSDQMITAGREPVSLGSVVFYDANEVSSQFFPLNDSEEPWFGLFTGFWPEGDNDRYGGPLVREWMLKQGKFGILSRKNQQSHNLVVDRTEFLANPRLHNLLIGTSRNLGKAHGFCFQDGVLKNTLFNCPLSPSGFSPFSSDVSPAAKRRRDEEKPTETRKKHKSTENPSSSSSSSSRKQKCKRKKGMDFVRSRVTDLTPTLTEKESPKMLDLDEIKSRVDQECKDTFQPSGISRWLCPKELSSDAKKECQTDDEKMNEGEEPNEVVFNLSMDKQIEHHINELHGSMVAVIEEDIQERTLTLREILEDIEGVNSIEYPASASSAPAVVEEDIDTTGEHQRKENNQGYLEAMKTEGELFLLKKALDRTFVYSSDEEEESSDEKQEEKYGKNLWTLSNEAHDLPFENASFVDMKNQVVRCHAKRNPQDKLSPVVLYVTDDASCSPNIIKGNPWNNTDVFRCFLLIGIDASIAYEIRGTKDPKKCIMALHVLFCEKDGFLLTGKKGTMQSKKRNCSSRVTLKSAAGVDVVEDLEKDHLYQTERRPGRASGERCPICWPTVNVPQEVLTDRQKRHDKLKKQDYEYRFERLLKDDAEPNDDFGIIRNLAQRANKNKIIPVYLMVLPLDKIKQGHKERTEAILGAMQTRTNQNDLKAEVNEMIKTEMSIIHMMRQNDIFKYLYTALEDPVDFYLKVILSNQSEFQQAFAELQEQA